MNIILPSGNPPEKSILPPVKPETVRPIAVNHQRRERDGKVVPHHYVKTGLWSKAMIAQATHRRTEHGKVVNNGVVVLANMHSVQALIADADLVDWALHKKNEAMLPELLERYGGKLYDDNGIQVPLNDETRETFYNPKRLVKAYLHDKERAWLDRRIRRIVKDLLPIMERVFGSKPTVVTNSGYGAHFYWWLPDHQGGAGSLWNIKKVRALNKVLVKRVNDHFGFHALDPAAVDAGTRCLREVGTFNNKGREPAKVRFIYRHPSRLIDLDAVPDNDVESPQKRKPRSRKRAKEAPAAKAPANEGSIEATGKVDRTYLPMAGSEVYETPFGDHTVDDIYWSLRDGETVKSIDPNGSQPGDTWFRRVPGALLRFYNGVHPYEHAAEDGISAWRYRPHPKRVSEEGGLVWLPECLADKGLRCPPGYLVTERGVRKLKSPKKEGNDGAEEQQVETPEEGEQVSAEVEAEIIEAAWKNTTLIALFPVVIGEVLKDQDTGTFMVEVYWQHGDEIINAVIPRASARDARRITAEANLGLPVTSANAKLLADYLARYEDHNVLILGNGKVTSRMGWKEGGFTWGYQWIGAEGAHAPGPDDIRFHVPERDGRAQFAHGLRAGGSFDEWKELVQPLERFPFVAFALFASVAPVFLSIVPTAEPFALDLSGPTSAGKTASMQVAASVWGYAVEGADRSIMGSWDTTQVGIEGQATLMNDLPCFINDTRYCPWKEKIPTIVYNLIAGRGRTRGTVQAGALRESMTWRTIPIVSGENAITAFSAEGGARARVITLQGLPFGEKSPRAARAVSRLQAGVAEHYGHAGPMIVQAILRGGPDLQEKIRDRYKERQRHYLDRIGQGGLENDAAPRMAGYFALVSVAASAFVKQCGLGWDHKAIIDEVWERSVASAGAADPAVRALAHVYEWAQVHESRFWLRTLGKNYQGWAGIWRKGAWGEIAFVPSVLTEVLQQGGFQPDAVLAGWKDRKWIKLDGNRSQVYRAFNGERSRMVVIRRVALQQAKLV